MLQLTPKLMFEQSFKTQISSLTDDNELVEELWAEINTQYSKTNRHYHNLDHLNNLESELLPLKDKISDWQVLLFSIAYHDIVYNTLKSDNEEKSARFADKRLLKLKLSDDQRGKCLSQIRATKAHVISEDVDTNYFTDADLAILGSDYDKYIHYVKSIRKEYKFYPDFVYNPGRKKVLEHFLQMQRIYKTDYFFNKYEEQARKNMNDEIRQLISG